MNRYYYINEIYNSILEWRLEGRKKKPTRKLVEDDFFNNNKDLKNKIESWVIYEYYMGTDGLMDEEPQPPYMDKHGHIHYWKYTLKLAAEEVKSNIRIYGENFYDGEVHFKQWIGKKKNKKLLKLK